MDLIKRNVYIYIYIYIYICLSVYLSICLCMKVTIPTFMVGGILRKDEMTNLGKLDHSGVLKNQRICLA